MTGPHAVAGPPIAWHYRCQACADLVADQLELAADQPGGARIRIYRCSSCGSTRSCRPGWRTRCHVCLDERSTSPDLTDAAGAFLCRLAQDPVAEKQAKIVAALESGRDRVRVLVEASSRLAVATAVRRAERPGSDVLATDLYGLPWTGIQIRADSHGTWGRHQACGTVALLGPGAVDCPSCGPAPGSRAHLARRDDPYLLYLVAHGRWQKFGVGDRRRVETHLRGGAEVIQVMRAPFAQVVLAESVLERQHRHHIAGRVRRGMIDSFGQATEVTRRNVAISLPDVLPGGEDVTAWFGIPGRVLGKR